MVEVHRDRLHRVDRRTARVPKYRHRAMTRIEDMVDDILEQHGQELTGYAVGSCLFIRASDNPDAWIEGEAVHLGDWR